MYRIISILIALLCISSNVHADTQFKSGQSFPSGDQNIRLMGGKSPSSTILPIMVDASGYLSIGAIVPGTGATNLGKAEDAAHSSGDVGILGLAVRNDAKATSFTTTNGDNIPLATTNAGAIWAAETVPEDNTASNADWLYPTGIVTNSALAASAATNGDWTWAKGDELGRTITTLAPAGESFQSCTGLITDTTQTAIKAAVASNRIYVTTLGCNNSAAIASTLTFQDGAATAIWQGGIGTQAATGGAYTVTFPVPLRLTSNTALNVTLGTTATNTRCCASGYISVN